MQNIQQLQSTIKQWRRSILENSANIHSLSLDQHIKSLCQIENHITSQVKIKSIMFIWQVLNHLIINHGVTIVDHSIQSIIVLLDKTFQIRLSAYWIKYHQSTLKCLLIFAHNYTVRLKQQPINYKITYKTLKGISTLQHYKLQTHQQIPQVNVDEQQWISWIVYATLKYHGIKSIIDYSQTIQFDNKIKQPILDYLKHSLNQTIEGRYTTQLVQGYPCKINDIKQMYSNVSTIKYLTISQADLKYICQLTVVEIKSYIQSVEKDYEKVLGNQKQQSSINQQQINLLYILLDILGKITFLGGYNTELQKMCQESLMKYLLKLLQINYLIYNLTDFISNNVHLSLENVSNNQKLAQFLQKPIISDIKSLKLLNLVPRNLIPITLKLLSNLVHINRSAQSFFQSQLKYFNIVLSLTHNHDRQMTMRQWSIIFIRHVSQCSLIMRQAIEKVKIDINIKQDKKFKHLDKIDM